MSAGHEKIISHDDRELPSIRILTSHLVIDLAKTVARSLNLSYNESPNCPAAVHEPKSVRGIYVTAVSVLELKNDLRELVDDQLHSEVGEMHVIDEHPIPIDCRLDEI